MQEEEEEEETEADGLPGYDRGEQQLMKGSVGEANGDVKLIGRKQTEHGRYGSLHRILGMIRNPLSDNLGVERFDPKQ